MGGERKSRVEQKIDTLSASVDRRFEAVDKRFEAVDKRFEAIDKRFEAIDRRFDEIDKRFAEVDKRFDEVSDSFVEQRRYTEFAFDRLSGEMREGFTRLERKLDQFIDVQLKTNQLVDRRLQALESRSDHRL